LVARPGRQAWRQSSRAGRGRAHRRQAREVLQPQRVRAADDGGARALRIPADDDAYEDDGGGQRVEHVRLGELRQSITGAQRRDERGGERSQSGPAAAAGLRSGSEIGEASRSRRLAPPLAAREDARVLLELLRRDLLAGRLLKKKT